MGNYFTFHWFIFMSTFLFSLYFFLLVSKSDQAPCVKGKMSVKYDSGVISLDELLHEKSEVKQTGRPRTVVSVSTNIDSESKSPTPILCYMLHVSNVLYVTSYYSFLAVFCIYHVKYACLYVFFSAGMQINATPYVNAPRSSVNAGSSTPKTRLRRKRVIQPSKFLLPPFAGIASTEKQRALYEKVIVHTNDNELSKLKGYVVF